ncbi:MAG: hypothetical protein GEV04_10345 [Actinophytocola sp.]|nr:hypothetical protein [Actinophytocola sp.]
MRADDAVARDLRALGDELTVDAPSDELTEAMMARVANEPIPRPMSRASAVVGNCARWLRNRKRAAATALAGVLIAGALTPPVRAAVVEWFDFAGVVVRPDSNPPPGGAPPPPDAGSALSLGDAAALVGFAPVVPDELGAADGIEVSDDRVVLSMTWRLDGHGVVRLDQFDGSLAPVFAKLAHDASYVTVGGNDALWFPSPHEVVVLAPDGTERTETARLAGRTLIWQRAGVTLRLEGTFDRARAIGVAESMTPIDDHLDGAGTGG